MKRLALALAALACACIPAAPLSAADATYPVLNGLQKKLKDMGDGTYAEQFYIAGGSIAGAAPASIVAGQVRLAVTGTAVCLSSAAMVNGVVVKALTSNSGAITVGGAGVNATIDGTGNGYILQPGEAMSFAVPNASLACINGPAAAGASYAGN